MGVGAAQDAEVRDTSFVCIENARLFLRLSPFLFLLLLLGLLGLLLLPLLSLLLLPLPLPPLPLF